ncbi:hypothetical protein JOA47_00405 [Klebsiella pneumoniae]|uniref:hypothetical protein n=1 Tax=Klebsiella pneumoniae TaxID=573 RepID=UPI001BD0447F|nr:hypothetical protein [Klebsiella pneumoniae]MBS8185745.1 hypothetical protein [Klebsiella pneumoniae]
MKERGMIFNGEMVRALLDGRKTQTRRIIKDCTVGSDQISKFIQIEKKFIGCYPEDVPELIRECCPYGVPGDRIWVREAFASGLSTKSTLAYRATHKREDLEDGFYDTIKWTPSIHMPRWASRILLEITGVRVERLNAISEEDARAEGIIDGGCLNCGEPEPCGCANPEPDATDAFAYLWQSIYGQESWNANPWVWVISFERVEGGAE